MTVSGEKDLIAIAAATELSGSQFMAVQVAGTLATTPGNALGILQTKTHSGDNAAVAYEGHLKAKAGGAVAAGALLSVSSTGYIITLANSDHVPVGKAIKACSSGGLVEGVFNFINARTNQGTGII